MKEIALRDIAKVIRSKNAGPFEMTLDIIFENKKDYEWVKGTGVVTKKLIAQLYGLSEEEILVFVYFDPANAIKATLPRNKPQGSIGETDMHATQQHVPLMEIMIPAQ
ncbi:MAG: DUF4387 domain-containing protein [bacterium]